LNLSTRITLNNGVQMPLLGLGVWQIPAGGPTRAAVKYALQCGYRLFDTAKMYGNERDVGAAVRESPVPRADIFVTTKVWSSDQGYRHTLAAFEQSLQRLGLEYLDLYLIHWPVEGLEAETWDAMIEILHGGRCRAVGVSNYEIPELRDLLARSTVIPAVNQIEFHPFRHERQLLEFCRAKGIVVEAYSPLTRGTRLGDRRLGEVARRYGRSPAQILIRWALQHELVVIPKSSRPERIRENGEAFDFELSDADMTLLDALHRSG
jgi:diketogulonate reductase-like aldo/keto reductase